MIAKILNKLTGLAVLLAVTFPVWAEPSKNSTPSPNGSAVLLLQSKHTNTKRVPSNVSLEIIYSEGILTLSSDYYVGEFSLSFENYETGATYEIPSIQIGGSAPLALEIGEYQLTAVGEDGTVLMGYMQVY